MKRSELEYAIKVATEIISSNEVLVIGSQSILGSFSEFELPARATASIEVDIAPLNDDERESLATLIDAHAGEWSEFQEEHGYYIQGVSVRTAYLPTGWASRLVPVQPLIAPGATGLCLEPHDLCAAKLARNDQKDREFVSALIDARLVSATTVIERIRSITDERFSEAMRSLALSFADSTLKRVQIRDV